MVINDYGERMGEEVPARTGVLIASSRLQKDKKNYNRADNAAKNRKHV